MMLFSYSSVAMSPALLLRLLLVAVYIILPFVQSYSLYKPTPPPGLPPSILSSSSRRTSKKQLKYAPPLGAYSVSAGTSKDGSRPSSSWRSKLPTPLERLASELGLFHKGKIFCLVLKLGDGST
jgi:hypothetical protein